MYSDPPTISSVTAGEATPEPVAIGAAAIGALPIVLGALVLIGVVHLTPEQVGGVIAGGTTLIGLVVTIVTRGRVMGMPKVAAAAAGAYTAGLAKRDVLAADPAQHDGAVWTEADAAALAQITATPIGDSAQAASAPAPVKADDTAADGVPAAEPAGASAASGPTLADRVQAIESRLGMSA